MGRVSEPFMETEDVFDAVGDLRRGAAAFTSAEGLQGVALSHAGGTEALATIAAANSALPVAFSARRWWSSAGDEECGREGGQVKLVGVDDRAVAIAGPPDVG